MKKIKSEMHLELEQAKLKLREESLEKSIKKDWKEVEESLHPLNLGKEILRKTIEKIKIFA